MNLAKNLVKMADGGMGPSIPLSRRFYPRVLDTVPTRHIIQSVPSKLSFDRFSLPEDFRCLKKNDMIPYTKTIPADKLPNIDQRITPQSFLQGHRSVLYKIA